MSQAHKDSLLKEYLVWQQRRLNDALLYFKNSTQDQFGLLGDLYLYNWLQREIQPPHKNAVLSLVIPKISEELTDLLTTKWDNGQYLQGLIAYWLTQTRSSQRKENSEKLLALHGGEISLAVEEILAAWQKLALFIQPQKEAIRQIQDLQKKRGAEVGGELDQQRVALIDSLPDSFTQDTFFS
ncbi:MAG: hypothetical protein HQL68_02050 [Magnetococcales bacterium]|nr:hypothetical protein [Magnetococcales bacterium]